MTRAVYHRLMNETYILGFTAMVSALSSWWIFAGMFALLWIRNICNPLPK